MRQLQCMRTGDGVYSKRRLCGCGSTEHGCKGVQVPVRRELFNSKFISTPVSGSSPRWGTWFMITSLYLFEIFYKAYNVYTTQILIRLDNKTNEAVFANELQLLVPYQLNPVFIAAPPTKVMAGYGEADADMWL